MEAGDSFDTKTIEAGNMTQQHIRTVPWTGEWNVFKRTLRAAALCSGTDSAVRMAEKLARGQTQHELEMSDPKLTKTADTTGRSGEWVGLLTHS